MNRSLITKAAVATTTATTMNQLRVKSMDKAYIQQFIH